LNASGVALNPANAGFYVNPIRNDATPVNICYYNTTTREVTYGGLINLIYPIGAIIQSSVSTNPGTYITGTTWVAYGAGQVLVGKATSGTFVTAGSTGGAETVTLIANNLPVHSHPNSLSDPGHSHLLVYGGSQGANRSVYGDYLLGGPINFFTPPIPEANTASAVSGPAVADTTTTGITITNANNVTTNAAVNILQPYIVVYTWTRTA
jgi:microcystin-dependent protein